MDTPSMLQHGNNTLFTRDGYYTFNCQSFSKDCALHEEGGTMSVSFTLHPYHLAWCPALSRSSV